MPPTGPATYQDIIRSYAHNVLRGVADTDLTPRQRRYTGILMNIASNAGVALVLYPPREETRQEVVKKMTDLVWQASALLTDAERRDLDVAIARAIECLGAV